MDLKVAPQTVHTQTTTKLRNAILSGYFKPGQRLVEAELCELMSVSRTSVREALRRLEAEKLITIVPNRGPSVSAITWEEAKDIYDVRADLLLSESLSAQAGRDLYRYARQGSRIVLPATVNGPLASPSVSLDVAAAAERALLTLLGSLGLLRLNGFYARIHAPTMGNTLGAGCVLLASMLVSSALAQRPVLHELLIAVFIVITSPVTTMLLMRAAIYRSRD